LETPNPTPEELPAAAESAQSVLAARNISDCWNKIGVSGNGSCPELAKHIHCRNCPVYAAAGAELLNRQLPANYRQEWTEHFSREKSRIAPGKLSAVIFRIGSEWLALPTRAFQEVAEYRAIHTLPHRHDGLILGLINFRGELLVCVSLSRLLGIERETIREKPCKVYDRLVIAEWQGSLLTFPVNEVYGVHRYNPEELQESPATVALASTTFTRGTFTWDNKRVGCLDEDSLFSTLNRSLA
jgi:chemotaxis-related protein WspD